MNVLISQVECNSCKAVIPSAGANGAVRLKGTTIDFCPACSQKTVAAAAETFAGAVTPSEPTATAPARGPGNPFDLYVLPNGMPMRVPKGGPAPQGGTLYAPAQAASASTKTS